MRICASDRSVSGGTRKKIQWALLSSPKPHDACLHHPLLTMLRLLPATAMLGLVVATPALADGHKHRPGSHATRTTTSPHRHAILIVLCDIDVACSIIFKAVSHRLLAHFCVLAFLPSISAPFPPATHNGRCIWSRPPKASFPPPRPRRFPGPPRRPQPMAPLR